MIRCGGDIGEGEGVGPAFRVRNSMKGTLLAAIPMLTQCSFILSHTPTMRAPFCCSGKCNVVC